MARVVAVTLREVEVFRPYPDEFPEALLEDAGADAACVARCRHAEIVRVAKRGGQVLGVYVMQRPQGSCFEVLALAVAAGARRQGLGRWLVGHAIGVAESKGGRQLLLPRTSLDSTSGGAAAAERFLARLEFVREARGLRHDLIPE